MLFLFKAPKIQVRVWLIFSRDLTWNSLCRLYEILELAEDMEIDIPHVWLYLAELVTPMLQEGGVPMGELFR